MTDPDNIAYKLPFVFVIGLRGLKDIYITLSSMFIILCDGPLFYNHKYVTSTS